MKKKYFSGIAMGILMMSASSLYSQSANKKAYVLNYGSFDNVRFGSIPMIPPHTITSIGYHGKTILTDDLAEDGNLYAFDKNKRMLVKMYNNGTSSEVGKVNIPSDYEIYGMSWNRKDKQMYAVALNGVQPRLYKIDLATGLAILKTTINGVTTPLWLEIDNNGNAFMADLKTDNLFSLDLETGNATAIGALGININYVQDADFDVSTNELFMAGYLLDLTSGIYKVDTTTGKANLIGDTNGLQFSMFTIAESLPDAPPVVPVTCGSIFMDTGGEFGNYGDNEDYSTVIVPSKAGENVTITFTQVEIQASPSNLGEKGGCWDYLTIYDGPTLDSPVLAESKCGETKDKRFPFLASSKLSEGDSFAANNPSGSLTVRFRSNNLVNKSGWKAIVSCATLAVDETNIEKVAFAPNPTTGILKINSKQKVEKIEIYNSAGNKLIETTTINNSQIDLSNLSSGVYIIKSFVNGKTFNNKIIKK